MSPYLKWSLLLILADHFSTFRKSMLINNSCFIVSSALLVHWSAEKHYRLQLEPLTSNIILRLLIKKEHDNIWPLSEMMKKRKRKKF